MEEVDVISCGVVFIPRDPTDEDKAFMEKLYQAFGIEVEEDDD